MVQKWKSSFVYRDLRSRKGRVAAYASLEAKFTERGAPNCEAVEEMVDHRHRCTDQNGEVDFQTTAVIAAASVKGFRRVENAFVNAV